MINVMIVGEQVSMSYLYTFIVDEGTNVSQPAARLIILIERPVIVNETVEQSA